ncbi:AAA family ATPase [Goodfellowiella coeruleoviolacea]|uniref:AAA family ATPase n=1 Tax=Goodfellowiella coeruleoviolacea TaxID=334858 RepID=UPI0020A243AE|nr:LuxR family transcriptional regulator [Goodfellowiella coeruleoviolacea]
MIGTPAPALGLRFRGRGAEQNAVDQLCWSARGHRGAALLVLGQPGMGRTALCEHAATALPGALVLRTRGVAEEQDVPHSGLHALLRPVADQLPTLLGSRADPLVSALELGRVAVPAPGAVLSAFLFALGALATEHPVLCCVDDADRLDPASRAALGFAARRVGSVRRVGILLTARAPEPEDGPGEWPAGIPAVTLPPLADADAAALLADLVPGQLDPAVREALLAAGAGVPGLLVELVDALTPEQLAGGAPLPPRLFTDGALLRRYAPRLRDLPADTQRLVLLAATAQEFTDTLDTDLLLRIAQHAGLDPARIEPAERAGVVRTDADLVRFPHPLLRQAIYQREPLAGRQAAHAVLAEVLTSPSQRLRRLRHLAASAPGPNSRLGNELASAVTALDGSATSGDSHLDRAEALARAAALADDEDTRAARLADAADHAWLAGRPDRARALLAQASGRATHPAVLGRIELVRGGIDLRAGIVEDAREALLLAAGLLAGTDPARALAALLGAAEASWLAGDIPGYRRIARQLVRAPGAPAGLRDFHTGMAATLAGDHATGVTALTRALTPEGRGGEDLDADPVALNRVVLAALMVGRVDVARAAATRAVGRARALGLATVVPQALEHLVYAELWTGRHGRAREHALAGLAAAERTGQRNRAVHHHAALAMVAALQGDPHACQQHAAVAVDHGRAHGLGLAVAVAGWSLARLDLAAQQPQLAVERLHLLAEDGHFAVAALAVPCLVEAAVLAGDPRPVRPALERFRRWAEATGDQTLTAQLLRCQAMLAEPAAADQLFARALTLHERTGAAFERARTHLLYGEMLRRRRRPSAARERLRRALLTFDACGARVWADRVRAELRVAGQADRVDPAGTARTDRPALATQLTPQQLRIARCVAAGSTNREVAVRLSLSPRTVDHHLRNVFAALGIRSRVELARIIAAEHRTPETWPERDRAAARPATRRGGQR